MNSNKAKHQENLEFIKLLHENRCLWDNADEDSRNITLRQLALGEIANHLQITDDTVRKKIHNLRSQFRREHIRIRKFGIKQKKWIYYDALKFLRNSFISRRPALKVGESFSENSTIDAELSDDNKDDDNTMSSFNEHSDSIRKQNGNLLLNKKFAKARNSSFTGLDLFEKEDEFATFGEHVANELRVLKNNQKLQQTLKCSILQAILDINKISCEPDFRKEFNS